MANAFGSTHGRAARGCAIAKHAAETPPCRCRVVYEPRSPPRLVILLRSHHGCSQPRAGFLARARGADGSCCGHHSVLTALAGEASFSSSSSCYSSAGERRRCLEGGKTKDTPSLGGSLQNTMLPAPHIGEENSAAKPISALQGFARCLQPDLCSSRIPKPHPPHASSVPVEGSGGLISPSPPAWAAACRSLPPLRSIAFAPGAE